MGRGGLEGTLQFVLVGCLLLGSGLYTKHVFFCGGLRSGPTALSEQDLNLRGGSSAPRRGDGGAAAAQLAAPPPPPSTPPPPLPSERQPRATVAPPKLPVWWVEGRESRPELKPTERFLLYPKDKTNGFNNQRIVLHISLLLAHALNRTLVLQDYQQSKHDSQATGMEEFIDLHALRQAVPVVLAREHAGDFRGRGADVAGMNLNPFRTGLAVEDIVAAYGNSTARVLSNPLTWGFPRVLLSYRSKALEAQHDALHRDHLHYRAGLVDVARQIIRNLGVAEFDAVHLRVGDRRPLPLVNCTARGLLVRDDRDRTCSNPEGNPNRPVLQQLVVIPEITRLPDIGKTVYVATNDEKNGWLRGFVGDLRSQGFRPVVLSEVLALDAGLKARISALSGGQIGVVEQIVCAYSRVFFPTFPSMWDEHVLAIRRWLAAPGAQAQSDLFDAKTAEMLHHDFRFRKNADRLASLPFP